MAKVNIRESLGRLDLLTDNKYDLRNTYDSSNISNDKKKKLAESISNNASAKQIYNILNETFNEDGVNVTEKISDDVRDGMFGGLIGKDTEWEVFFESGPTDILDSDIEDMANDISNGRLSGKTNNGVGWQIRVRYGDDFYDYNCLNCPENDYVGSRWEEYDESLNEEDNFNSDEYERKHILRLAKSVEEASKRKGMNISNLKKTAKRYIENHKDTKHKKELDMLIKAYKSLDEKEECLEEDTVKQNGKWVNKGSEGTHGKFKTKKAADAQRKAMFANGHKAEALEESVEDGYMKHADADARKIKSLYRKNKDIDSAFSSLGYTDNRDGSYEKEVEDNVFIVFEYDEDSERLEYNVVNEETRTGTPSNVLNLSKKLKERVQRVTEASYGGAYDIEDDMFWTKDDLIEFSDAVCEKLADKFGYQYDIADVGAESNNDMYITIMDTTHDIEADVSFRIKMSRIRAPRDLMKYLDTVVSEFVKKFEEEYQYYEFDESLKEAVEDEIDVDEYEETDFNDGEVEEGDTFIEDGREWSWIERIAGPIHLDFDNWAVWSARDWDYIQEKIRPILLNKEELTVETLTKIYDEAEVAYFVVDEDTGFIDWGPVESQTEAQDFLNSKVEDWENEDEYDESLKESKQLKESYGLELEYEDIDGDGSSYTYEPSDNAVLEYLRDCDDCPEWVNNLPDEEYGKWFDSKEFEEWLEDNLYELFEKHYDDLLDYFKEDAQTEYFDKYGDEYSQDRETGSWYRKRW